MAGAIVGIVVLVFLVILFARTVRIVPQARAGIVERFGRYNRTLNPGLTILMPFVDRLKPLIDLREQVVSFPPSAGFGCLGLFQFDCPSRRSASWSSTPSVTQPRFPGCLGIQASGR